MKERETCKMIEYGTKVICSECGANISYEIYYMFDEPQDLNYCPVCGRKVEK